jgi:hypothetical protein
MLDPTEHIGSSGDTFGLYSGVTRFEYRLGHYLDRLFVFFLNAYRQIRGQCVIKSDHTFFPPSSLLTVFSVSPRAKLNLVLDYTFVLPK